MKLKEKSHCIWHYFYWSNIKWGAKIKIPYAAAAAGVDIDVEKIKERPLDIIKLFHFSLWYVVKMLLYINSNEKV